ncbi:LAMI_0B00474g1_1 [Lachancea mirantina]|uniref:LAMI_0B00474g1_1 n=1 Tax=Lachancea mirantina TaxID=1230905 RepID=A0A1G4ITK9_9SACH|nr:LAMI_0B00474g1_1 [Lachancea mirantina]
MNRVRSLIGGSSSNRRTQNFNQTDEPTAQSQNSALNESDQATMFESDIATTHTNSSDSSTIGDFQRNGFINRCPVFTSERNIPFAHTLLGKGFYCFPSEEAFAVFRKNKRRLDVLDDDEGLGIPLLHAVPSGVIKTIISRREPISRIYKYILVLPNEPSPMELRDGICELIAENNSRKLYKVEFCQVFKEVDVDSCRVEHKFLFRLNEQSRNMFSIKMVNSIFKRGTDTRVEGLNLRWYGTSGLASPFGSGHFKVLVLDDGMPSLLDEPTDESYERARREAQPLRPLRLMPIWASYTNETATYIPRKRTLRLANFLIKENGAESKGIRNTPLSTDIITCMAMVLHDLESRKDRRNVRAGYLPTGTMNIGPAFM